MLILNSNVNVLYFPQINTTYVLYKITLMFTNTNSEYTMSKTSCILNVPVLHRCKPACVTLIVFPL